MTFPRKRILPAARTAVWRRCACIARLVALAILAGSMLVAASGTLIARMLPKPPLRSTIPASTAVSARSGELLRLTLAADGQYRLWVELDQMPARLPSAVLSYEDQWFYQHPGVNPVSLIRAAVNYRTAGRRIGASTITMQVARRLYRLDTRSPLGKLHQIACAWWLEARYSKHEILETYLNLAPYGRNVEGVGAASLVFFGRPVSQLSVPQIMTLAVIPQNPRVRRLGSDTGAAARSRSEPDLRGDLRSRGEPSPGGDAGSRGSELDDARGRLWARWLTAHPADARFSGEMGLPIEAKSPAALPFLAPHFTDTVLRQAHGTAHTTLDLARQNTVERILRHYVGEQSALGIRNAGVLLLDVNGGTAQVRAYVGSADYRNTEIDGQVNAVTAKRSPGSTLKPFVYALALDQGLLHPRTILKDTPSSFGPFSPENFDGRFVGPIAAEDALIRSRNVPAVAIASQLSQPNLYDFLRASGVAHMNGERYYGLALALGGGEVSMEELGRMYAIFLNGGRVAPLQYLTDPPASAAPAMPAAERLLSDEASFITLDMLEKNPRPDTGQPASPAVAWKTGTSWGFHDAWSVGVFGHYVLVVWVGNFDNTGNPAFVGVQAAAPLLFRIIDALRSQGLDPIGPRRPTPANVARIEVCGASGDLPNADCPQTVATWYIPGKSPIRVSQLHRRVYVDAAGHAACGPGPGVHEEVYEFWTSDMLRLFREAGMPRRVPPVAAQCATAPGNAFTAERGGHGADGDAPEIVSPLRGVMYTLRAAHLEPLALRANIAARSQAIYWFADKAYLGRAPRGEDLTWLPPRAGHYLLRAVDDTGAGDTRELDIDVVP